MSLELGLYLIAISGNIKVFATLATILLGIASFVLVSGTLMGIDQELPSKNSVKTFNSYRAFSLSLFFFFAIVNVLIPSKGELYAIAAVKAGKEVTQSMKESPLVEKSLKALEMKLDEVIKPKQ